LPEYVLSCAVTRRSARAGTGQGKRRRSVGRLVRGARGGDLHYGADKREHERGEERAVDVRGPVVVGVLVVGLV
jgi:hypothetical protein